MEKNIHSNLENTPLYLYEVSIYRTDSNRSNLLRTRYYTSPKLLTAPEYMLIKQFPTFRLERFITLIGAPQNDNENEERTC
jgi:hypothetical protein